MSHDSWLTLACRLGKRFTTGLVLAIMLVITSDGIGGGIQPLAAYEVQAVSSEAEEEGWEADTDGEKRTQGEENTVDEENKGRNIEVENVEGIKTEEDKGENNNTDEDNADENNAKVDITGKSMGKWIHIRMLRPVLNTEELALPGEGQLLAGTTLLRPMTRWQEVQQEKGKVPEPQEFRQGLGELNELRGRQLGLEQVGAKQVRAQMEQGTSPVITAGTASNGAGLSDVGADGAECAAQAEQTPQNRQTIQTEPVAQMEQSSQPDSLPQSEQATQAVQEAQVELAGQTEQEDHSEPSGPVIVCSGKDYEVLKKIVEAEAGICDMKGRILVADVVINRVKSEEFPDTVTDVVYQKSQFSPVYDGRLKSCRVSAETIEAVDRALAGEDYSQGALYFMNRKLSSSRNVRWFDRNLTYLFYHDRHEFFR